MNRIWILALLMVTGMTVWGKKPAEQPADLATWIRSQSLPDEIDGVRIFRINGEAPEGGAASSGFVDLPATTTNQGFVAALIYVCDNMDKETDAITAVDFDKKRFVVSRLVHSGEGKKAASYLYDTAFQFTDDMMTFISYDIGVEFKEKGLIPRKTGIDRLKPESNERHRELMENFAIANSEYIDAIARFISENKNFEVTHWDEISAGKVVKGMNECEVKLIGGAPRSTNTSGGRTQWIYSNDFIVVFSDGVVTNAIQ